jgi:hypothetical protein
MLRDWASRDLIKDLNWDCGEGDGITIRIVLRITVIRRSISRAREINPNCQLGPVWLPPSKRKVLLNPAIPKNGEIQWCFEPEVNEEGYALAYLPG